MMKKVKFCSDCKWSKPEIHSEWTNKCYHPLVVARNAWALGGNCGIDRKESCGVNCYDERGKRNIFAACGIKGKLWESKHND